jgi:hypothetical protein
MTHAKSLANNIECLISRIIEAPTVSARTSRCAFAASAAGPIHAQFPGKIKPANHQHKDPRGRLFR